MSATDDFEECGPCSRKPGSPTLCPPCLHNRRTIDALRAEVAALREKLDETATGDNWRSRAIRAERDLATARADLKEMAQLRHEAIVEKYATRALLARVEADGIPDNRLNADVRAFLDPRRDEARGVKRCRWCAGAGCMGCQPRDEARGAPVVGCACGQSFLHDNDAAKCPKEARGAPECRCGVFGGPLGRFHIFPHDGGCPADKARAAPTEPAPGKAGQVADENASHQVLNKNPRGNTKT